MNFEIAAINARYEQDAMVRRANHFGPMGNVPGARSLFAGRRQAAPLTAIVEVCHPHRPESERIARRLRDLSAPASQMERKAS